MMKLKLWEKALIGGIAAMTLSGAASSALAQDKWFSPFERVATLDAVYTEDGAVDEYASYLKAQEVGKAIADYIHETDESAALGFPSNWVVAGAHADEETVDEALLHVPSALTITRPDGKVIPKKVQVIEICNKTYAGKALGVFDITDGTPIAGGYIHSAALPCEISVHNEGDKIHVNMLNAEAIFTLFFSDVITGDQMLDPDFAEQMDMLPGAVKGEMRQMIHAALDDADYNYEETADMNGPIYHNVANAVAEVARSLNQSPYVHFRYTGTDGGAFDAAAIAAAVTETMSLDYDGRADLLTILSENSSWRPARSIPLKMPGNNYVVEPCSPLYAKKAIGETRLDHATALPCEIAFKTVNNDTELIVSFLDPNFMFGAMFGDMTGEEKNLLKDIPAMVLEDLQTIVRYSFDRMRIGEGEQVYYDMLNGWYPMVGDGSLNGVSSSVKRKNK